MAEYYDMQEVMDKLRKTEDEVHELVKQGQLRQYLDNGKPVFKIDDVDTLAEEIVGLDITSFGGEDDLEMDLDLGKTSEGLQAEAVSDELDLNLEETAEDIMLAPDDEDAQPDKGTGPDDMELDIEPDIKKKESEGGFGLSQMGDLTMADTNVGTVGINILSGTGDAYKLTEDTKAETSAGEIDELESLDADANLESLGSGSGLLDLSLQADDTSLGAVLDDILPTGAEGAGDLPMDQGIGLEEAPDLAEPAAIGSRQEPIVSIPVASAEPLAGPAGFAQTYAIVPVDPKTNIFGVMMFLPVLGLVLAAIVLTAAVQNVTPSLVKRIVDTHIADINLIWFIVGGLTLLLLILLAFSAVMGGGGSVKAPKAAKAKAKKEKPAKEKKGKKRK